MQVEFATRFQPKTAAELILQHGRQLNETGRDVRRQPSQKANRPHWKLENMRKRLELERLR